MGISLGQHNIYLTFNIIVLFQTTVPAYPCYNAMHLGANKQKVGLNHLQAHLGVMIFKTRILYICTWKKLGFFIYQGNCFDVAVLNAHFFGF